MELNEVVLSNFLIFCCTNTVLMSHCVNASTCQLSLLRGNAIFCEGTQKELREYAQKLREYAQELREYAQELRKYAILQKKKNCPNLSLHMPLKIACSINLYVQSSTVLRFPIIKAAC